MSTSVAHPHAIVVCHALDLERTHRFGRDVPLAAFGAIGLSSLALWLTAGWQDPVLLAAVGLLDALVLGAAVASRLSAGRTAGWVERIDRRGVETESPCLHPRMVGADGCGVLLEYRYSAGGRSFIGRHRVTWRYLALSGPRPVARLRYDPGHPERHVVLGLRATGV